MLRILLLGALLLPATAMAEATKSCADAPNQMEANACVADQFTQADAELNRLYGVLRAKLDATGRRNLVAAERAWVTFRDLECNLRTGFDTQNPDQNGSIAPMLTSMCQTELTRQRSTDLRAQIKCPGGDLSCTP